MPNIFLMAGEQVCNLVDNYVYVDENIFFCDKNFTLLNLLSEQDTLIDACRE